MSARLNLLPDPRFESLHADVRARVRAATSALDNETFLDVFDVLMRRVLEVGLANAGAHEGTVWLADRARVELVAVYNTGHLAERIKGFRQPLSAGIISMVYRSEQPFCENEVHTHRTHSKSLDEELRVITTAMIAVPLYFAQETQGVVSCVQIAAAEDAAQADLAGFPPESLRQIQFTAAVLTRLIDHALLGAAIGLGGV